MTVRKRFVVGAAVAILAFSAACGVAALAQEAVFLPTVQEGARDPGMEWRALQELAGHCLYWGELLDCVEFLEASQLDAGACKRVESLALVVCEVIGVE